MQHGAYLMVFGKVMVLALFSPSAMRVMALPNSVSETYSPILGPFVPVLYATKFACAVGANVSAEVHYFYPKALFGTNILVPSAHLYVVRSWFRPLTPDALGAVFRPESLSIWRGNIRAASTFPARVFTFRGDGSAVPTLPPSTLTMYQQYIRLSVCRPRPSYHSSASPKSTSLPAASTA